MAFAGVPFEATSPQAAQAAGISTIYQESNLVGLRSVTENICLGRPTRRFGLLDWPRMHQQAASLLGRFGVHIDVRRPLAGFPAATQQMVAIARAIGLAAKLVIMDEPTSSLTEREVAVLFGVIGQLRAQGVSVVFVSHKLDELYAVCDRVTIMRDGRTVLAAALAGLPKAELVAQMLGRTAQTLERRGATGFGQKARMTGPGLLELDGLTAPPRVLQADLHVAKGEIVGLAGLLGAGRTEAARIVAGAAVPASGAMRLAGQAFAPASPAAAIAAGVGFLTEDRKLEGIVPDLSVRENLTLAVLPALSRAGLVNERAQSAIVDRYIAHLGIRCAGRDQPVRQLSGGNQQKVLLARWLCMNPVLLILDEPTRGIDVGAKAEIQRIVRALANDGLGVLMISSEVEEITEGADRAYVMCDGRIGAELAGPGLTSAAILDALAHGAGVEAAFV